MSAIAHFILFLVVVVIICHDGGLHFLVVLITEQNIMWLAEPKNLLSRRCVPMAICLCRYAWFVCSFAFTLSLFISSL
jgi:hypothetical protein